MLTAADDHTRNCSPKDMDIISETPKGQEEAELVVCGNPGLETGRRGDVDAHSQPVNYPGLQQLRFDNQGMLLPHSILGSLEDFRSYLQDRRESDLVKRIPKSVGDPLSEITGRHRSGTVGGGNIPGHANRETNALRHWDTRMEQRRRQQNQLSELLDSPVENLLMNKANHFRETQEEKETLNQALPLIQSGYGRRVGSEFWSFPQRYGDELSGITATLTQAELGRRRAVTHVGQPNRVRQESGLLHGETSQPASQARGQSLYLRHKMEELGELLSDNRKPDISRLEVLGSRKPFTLMCQSPRMEMEEKQEELEDEDEENIDSLTDGHDVQLDALCVPALRFCGQLATWTGNSAMKRQGEVAISSTVILETLTGEAATSRLELHNEGSTAIYFNWHNLPMKHSFRVLPAHTTKPHFYFNSCPGVICPGDTHQVEVIFRPEEPGIQAEHWQLDTHPVLLQGASIQVTLRGVALPQDQTADQRLFIGNKLEKAVAAKMCKSIVEEVILGVHSPERPSSPEERYITEEQKFLIENPKLPFVHEPVQNLKRLWQEVSPGHSWDMSVDTLRQAMLSVPDEEPTEGRLTREEGLARMNSLLLQLSESSGRKHHRLPASTMGQQLMKRLLEGMVDEASQLRNLLGLPLSETWADRSDQSITSDSVLSDTSKDEESEKRGRRVRTTFKDDNTQNSRSHIAERSVQESKRHGKRRDEVGKSSRAKPGNELLVDARSEDISERAPDVNPVKLIYTRLLHKKVYALMEDFVDSLCDLVDEVNSGDEADAHQRHELTHATLAQFM